jgi:hypothetical protein
MEYGLLTPAEIAQAYSDAHSILKTAQYEVINVDVLWRKVKRVIAYLESQATEELRATLSE